MKLYIVSDLHITQSNTLFSNKKSMSERSIQLLKSFLNLQLTPNEDVLLIGGDLFDNISKITYFDMLLYGKIVSLFKKVYLINGNHDIMNQIVNVTNLLSTYKRTITVKEVSTIQFSPDLYIHFIPYYPKEFFKDIVDNTLTDIVIEKIKNVITTNTYHNRSLHLFISHAEISEIITQFENVDVTNNPHYLNYNELRMFLQTSNLNYKFFQGHYHTKDIRIPDDNYYVITCFPKSFSEKTTVHNNIYGYYEFDLNTYQLTFNEWPHQVKYLEFMSNEYDKYEPFLNDNHHLYVVKLHLTDNSNIDDVVINKLSNNSHVKKLITLSNLLKDNKLQQETEIVEEKYLTFEEYFVEYLMEYIQSLRNKGITYDEELLINLFNTYVVNLNSLSNQQG